VLLVVEMAADGRTNRRGGRPPGRGPLWCL